VNKARVDWQLDFVTAEAQRLGLDGLWGYYVCRRFVFAEMGNPLLAIVGRAV
jgi:hypothetical protein